MRRSPRRDCWPMSELFCPECDAARPPRGRCPACGTFAAPVEHESKGGSGTTRPPDGRGSGDGVPWNPLARAAAPF